MGWWKAVDGMVEGCRWTGVRLFLTYIDPTSFYQ